MSYIPGLALSAKGDLASSDGTTAVVVPVGPDGDRLTARSSAASGVAWEGDIAISKSGSIFSMDGPAGAPNAVAAYDFTQFDPTKTLTQNLQGTNISGNAAYDLVPVGTPSYDYSAKLSAGNGIYPYQSSVLGGGLQAETLVSSLKGATTNLGANNNLRITGALTFELLLSEQLERQDQQHRVVVHSEHLRNRTVVAGQQHQQELGVHLMSLLIPAQTPSVSLVTTSSSRLVDLSIAVPSNRGVQFNGWVIQDAPVEAGDVYVLRFNGANVFDTYGGYIWRNTTALTSGTFPSNGNGIIQLSDGFSSGFFTFTANVGAFDPVLGGRSVVVTTRETANGAALWSTFTNEDLTDLTSIGIALVRNADVISIGSRFTANVGNVQTWGI
jgi:hypothetical protein